MTAGTHRWKSAWGAWLLAVAGLLGGNAQAESTLWTIAADSQGTGRVLTVLGSAEPGTELFDGTLAFNGGLAWQASTGRLLLIGNDAQGLSYLSSLDLAAPTELSPLLNLGEGFSGLALDAPHDRLYAVASDAQGAASLFTIDPALGATPLAPLPGGFYSGLSYQADSHSLLAIGADESGVPRRLWRITLDEAGAPLAPEALFDLGDGSLAFAGGLAWDPVAGMADRFEVLATDSSGDSRLFSFTLAGGAASLADSGALLPPGLLHGGLAAVSLVPEPAAAWLITAGLLALRARRRWRPPAAP